jgi:hypothetical protein
MNSIDLGRKDLSGPCSPCSVPSPEPDAKPRVSYPSLYIEGKGDELAGLPDEGVMTVEYAVKRKTVSQDDDGKKTFNMAIDVCKIIDAKAPAEKSASESLDELAKQVSGGDEDEGE